MQLRRRSTTRARSPSPPASSKRSASPTRARAASPTTSRSSSIKSASSPKASPPKATPTETAARGRSPSRTSSRGKLDEPAATAASTLISRNRSISPAPTSPKQQQQHPVQHQVHEEEHPVSGIASVWRLFSFFKNHWFRQFGILVLALGTPFTVFALFQLANAPYNGSACKYYEAIKANPRLFIDKIDIPTWAEGRAVLGFVVFQWLLLCLVPGKTGKGPITPMGNEPQYKYNGVACYLITHAVFLLATSPNLQLFPGGWLYDHLGPILTLLNVTALPFCVFNYFRGLHAPSSSDSGVSGKGFLQDFWSGTELHPRIFGHSLKQLINCRVSMIGWSVLCVSFALKAVELHNGALRHGIIVSAALQWVYLLKFFIWESGYFGSMDIQHDRFGFYICWGVLVWVPCVYTYHTYNMVHQTHDLSLQNAIIVFVLGVVSIYINWQADDQRQRCRDSRGECLIWGSVPDVIRAEYTTGDGNIHSSVLLCSGWWGVARHFHYVPELAAAFFWTLPVGFDRVAPWFYPLYLFILLMDRAYRDEVRCSAKYGHSWRQLCARVPYRVVPYIY